MVDAPKFAAYGYDLGLGTWESPEPHPDLTARDWIWSADDTVKRWDRTALDGRSDARLPQGAPR